MARPGAGKRGGYRTIIAYRRPDRAVFLYGFAKNAKADLTPDELEDLAEIGADWLKAGDEVIGAAIADDRLVELDDGAEGEG